MTDPQQATIPTWKVTVALAIAYLIVGRLALLLALPPGYASPIWPAAGLALAAVYLWGWRVWPGIWIGSVLANAPIDIDFTNINDVLGALWIPFVLGLGPPTQAVVGALTLRRVLGSNNQLDSLGDVAVFFAIAGPLSCLISTTLGNTTLLMANAIEPASPKESRKVTAKP